MSDEECKQWIDEKKIMSNGSWKIISRSSVPTTLETVHFGSEWVEASVCFGLGGIWCHIGYRRHCQLTSLGYVLLDDCQLWHIGHGQRGVLQLSIPDSILASSAISNTRSSMVAPIRFGGRKTQWHPTPRAWPRRSFRFLLQSQMRSRMRLFLGRMYQQTTAPSATPSIVRIIACTFPKSSGHLVSDWAMPPTKVALEFLSPRDIWKPTGEINIDWLNSTKTKVPLSLDQWSIVGYWKDDPDPEQVRIRIGTRDYAPFHPVRK